MDLMCHVCARCFNSVETLRNHIQDERSRLIRDIEALCTKPHHTTSSALGILLRYATHTTDLDKRHDTTNLTFDPKRSTSLSTEAHDEQNLVCPEPSCDYASTAEYQLLQRHYMTHVLCDEACPFCSRPLRKASQFIRHPDECATRKRLGIEVPGTFRERQHSLAEQVCRRLRVCQHKNRVRRGSSYTERSGRVEGGTTLASSHLPADTDHCHSFPMMPYHELFRPETSSTATTAAPYHPRSHCGEPTSKSDDCSYGFGCAGSAALPAACSASEPHPGANNFFLQTSSMVPPAFALGNSGDDRTAAYPRGPELTTPGDASRLSVLLPIGVTSQRAPTLSNSLVDGTMFYLPADHSTEEVSSRSLDLFSFGGATAQRAPTRSDSLIDGQMVSNSVQRPTEVIPLCPPDPFAIRESGQRAPILSNSLIDGVMTGSLANQYTTMLEGMSSFQSNSVLTSHALSSDQGGPDSATKSSDAVQRAMRETNSTGEGAAAPRHLDYPIPTTPDQSAAHRYRSFTTSDTQDLCSAQITRPMAQGLGLDIFA